MSLAYDSLVVPLIEILANCVSKMNFATVKNFILKRWQRIEFMSEFFAGRLKRTNLNLVYKRIIRELVYLVTSNDRVVWLYIELNCNPSRCMQAGCAYVHIE